MRHRQLGLARENDLIGEGISYCAVCDGAFYKGQHVAVIGGGNSALQEAILLSETCSKVTVIQNLPFLTGEQSLQDVLATRKNVEVILGISGHRALGQHISDRYQVRNENSGDISELSVEGVFVAIGLEPVNGAFAEVAVLDNYGYFDANETCVTRTPGVYVRGVAAAKVSGRYNGCGRWCNCRACRVQVFGRTVKNSIQKTSRQGRDHFLMP